MVLPDKESTFGKVLACFIVILCVASWLAMGELLQEFPLAERQPALFSCGTQASYILMLPVGLAMRCASGDENAASVIGKFLLMGPLAVIWWISIWSWYASVTGMSMAANTVIYQSACIFVYAFSICLLGETLQLNKILGVLLAVVGVFMIVSQKEEAEGLEERSICYFYCIISTLFYALFEVLYDRFYVGQHVPHKEDVDDEEEVSHPKVGMCEIILALGLRGLVVFLITPGALGFLNWTGQEVLKYPSEKETWQLVYISLMDWVFNIGFLLGIVVFSPLWITVGLVLVIPAGLITDFLLRDLEVTNIAILGTLAVLAAFLLLNIPATNSDDDFSEEEEESDKEHELADERDSI